MRIKAWDHRTVPSKEWDNFVQNSQQGTLFSESRFYQHHDKQAGEQYLGVFKKDKLIGGIVGIKRDEVFQSPVMASYGGFMWEKESRFKYIEEILIHSCAHLREEGISTLKLTPPPDVYGFEPDQTLDYLINYYGGTVSQTLISSVISAHDYTLGSHCSSTKRWEIRRAERNGIRVKKIDDFDAFYPILLENKAKFKLKPTHSLSELIKLFELFPERIHLFGAYFEDQLVGGLINFDANKQTTLTFYIAAKDEYQELLPVQRLIHEAVSDARRRSFSWMDLGVSMETDTDNPMDPRRSLLFFKNGFGAIGQTRKTYELPISEI
jgi:lipid II:glycine glycyltransferase (peptidoglycan interpeptide bridge formation enzyme)